MNNPLTDGFGRAPHGSLKEIKKRISEAAKRRGCVQLRSDFCRPRGINRTAKP
jgi:hypothetical protein